MIFKGPPAQMRPRAKTPVFFNKIFHKDMPSYQQNFMNWGAIEVE